MGKGKKQRNQRGFLDLSAAAGAVRAGIQTCLDQAGISAQMLEGVYLFIPGFRNAMEQLRKWFPQTKFCLFSDEYNAFYGALGAPEGIAVLSGTSSC